MEILNIVVEVDNGIGNELSRSMVCNLVVNSNIIRLEDIYLSPALNTE